MLSGDIVTNEELLWSWYQGNENAFGILDQRVRGELIGRAYHRLPGCLPAKAETAEDLASETMAKVLSTCGRPQARWLPEKHVSVLNWLMGILRHEIVSLMRRKKGKERLMTDLASTGAAGEAERFENTIPDHRSGPEQRMHEAEQRERLREAVQRLSEQDRAILRMRIEEQKTLDEIGRKHGLSRSTAYRRLRDIFQALAARMEDVPRHFELPGEGVN
jgi:RNA polymerase sigma-70 factor (ECF subfamily)